MSDIRVLLVEDEVDGQEVVSTILEMNGLDVDVVADGKGALTMLDTNHYDVAVLDIALPDMDGWGLLSEIRNRDNLSHLHCIAITAYHDSSVRQKSMDAGFDSYLPKPINSNHLMKALNKFI